MATLAEMLRQTGYAKGGQLEAPVPTQPNLSTMAGDYFRQLPAKTAQNAIDMNYMVQNAMPYNPQTGKFDTGPTFSEFANFVPNLMGSVANVVPTAQRMLIAQKNAALPISEGGLGLAANNTAAQRAKALNYETPVYHGTNAEIEAFNVKGKGKTAGAGAFLTTNPVTAETYVSASGGGNILPLLLKKDDFLTTNARGRSWADINTNDLAAKSGKNRYTPQELGLDINSATTTDELGMIANELSKKGVEIKNVKDLGPNSHVMRAKEYLLEKYGITPDETWSNVTGKQWDESQKAIKKLYESQKSDIFAIQDPSLIRSKFAAFDPKRAKEADILAAGLAIPMPKEEEKKTRKDLIKDQINKID
jgi:hypothetical protein